MIVLVDDAFLTGVVRVWLATDGPKCKEEAAWFLSRRPDQGNLNLTILTVLSPPLTLFYSPTEDLMTEVIKEHRGYAEQRPRTTSELFEGANANLESRIVGGIHGRRLSITQPSVNLI